MGNRTRHLPQGKRSYLPQACGEPAPYPQLPGSKGSDQPPALWPRWEPCVQGAGPAGLLGGQPNHPPSLLPLKKGAEPGLVSRDDSDSHTVSSRFPGWISLGKGRAGPSPGRLAQGEGRAGPCKSGEPEEPPRPVLQVPRCFTHKTQTAVDTLACIPGSGPWKAEATCPRAGSGGLHTSHQHTLLHTRHSHTDTRLLHVKALPPQGLTQPPWRGSPVLSQLQGTQHPPGRGCPSSCRVPTARALDLNSATQSSEQR